MKTAKLIELTKQLIATASTADNSAALHEAIAFIERFIRSNADVTIERFEHNGKPSLLAYAGTTRPKKFAVLLNGHLDVVPAKPGQFKPIVKGNKLYGRGALDMKAAALVLTEVFCQLAPSFSLPLGLQIVTDEEVGGHNGTAYQISQGVMADFVVCGEFTPMAAICNESRGICQARLHFRGKTAHSAYLWDGSNAIVAANEYITKLLQIYPVPTKQKWATTASISNIASANATINQVPASCTVDIDIRYVPNDPNFATKKSAEKFLRSLADNAVPEIKFFEPAHYADPNHPYSQKLKAALAQVSDKPVQFIQKPGGADVRFYSAKGVPAMVMGVQGQGLHSDDEYVLLDSLESYSQALGLFLKSVELW